MRGSFRDPLAARPEFRETHRTGIAMRRLFTAIVAFAACLAAGARAATEAGPGSPPSESGLVIWILAGVFAFFVLVIGFTWFLIKSERKRPLEHKPPE
jgi:hypothetical protein